MKWIQFVVVFGGFGCIEVEDCFDVEVSDEEVGIGILQDEYVYVVVLGYFFDEVCQFIVEFEIQEIDWWIVDCGEESFGVKFGMD